MLLIQTPIEVRQDGETDDEIIEEEITEAPNAPPDWQLVEKLNQLSQSEVTQEVPHPELPPAPDLPTDLDLVQAQDLGPLSLEDEQALPTLEAPMEEAPVEEKLPTIDNPPEHQQMSEQSEVWNPKKELIADSQWAVYWQ